MSTATQSFNIQLAMELGSVDLAIIVQFFVNVLSIHKRVGRNKHDNRTWNFCSKKELQAYFPYWTEKMIRTRVDQLVEMGILIEDNYNAKKYDRTTWFAFLDEEKWLPDIVSPICPNGQMDLPKRANGFAQTGKPIPPHYSPTYIIGNDSPNVEAAMESLPESLPPIGGVLVSALPPGCKYPLKKEQKEALDLLLPLEIGCKLESLYILVRLHNKKKIEEAIYHMKIEIERGMVFKKPKIAFLRHLLSGKVVLMTEKSEKNKKFSQTISKEFSWPSLEIHEKFVICNKTGKELPLNMDCKEFCTQLEQIYHLSKKY